MVPLLDIPAVHRRPAGVVAVSGPDRLSYLHSLLSQHLEAAPAGTVADFLYLDAKGNPQAEGQAVVRSGDVWLVTPAEVAADFAAALDRFRFLLQVEVVDRSGAFAVASVRGPGPVEVPGARSEPMSAAPHGDGVVLRQRDGGADLVGPASWVEDKVAGLLADGMAEADAESWEAWRISSGRPAWGQDIAAGRRAQELGLLPTHVHLRKGCYPGQESIAKIHNLGKPRRALAVVDFEGPIAAGSALTAADGAAAGKAGEVTSAAALGSGAVALVLVPVDRDGGVPSQVVTADGVRGRVRQRVAQGLVQPGA